MDRSFVKKSKRLAYLFCLHSLLGSNTGKEVEVGKSNEIKTALKAARSREFVIDTETGVITEENPEPEVAAANQPAPAPIQAAHYTYD